MNRLSELIVFPDGATYRRTGDCDGCRRPGLTPGQCCTYIMLPLARDLSADEGYWVELHDGLHIQGSAVRLDVHCSALKDGRCELFGTSQRPQICNDYPEHAELDAGCAYQFQEVSAVGAGVRPR